VVGLLVVLSGVLSQPTAAAQSAPPATGLGLAVSVPKSGYVPGESIPLTYRVTNRGSAACRLAATPEGPLRITGVTRNGRAQMPLLAHSYYLDGLDTSIRRSLRTAEPGSGVTIRSDATPLDPSGKDLSLLAVSPLPGGDGLTSIWPVHGPGRYVVSATYEVPRVTDTAPSLCAAASNVATVTFTVGRPGSSSRSPWLLLALVAGVALAGAAVVLLVLRGHRRPVSAVVIVLAVAVALPAVGMRRADAKVVVDTSSKSRDFADAAAGCLAGFAAPGGDPEHIMGRLNNPKTPRVQVRKAPSSDSDSETFDTPLSPQGKGSSVIVWNPFSEEPYGDGVPRDPCAALYHELVHASGFSSRSTAQGDCGGVPKEEMRATIAENKYRASRQPPLLPRTEYKGVKVPDKLSDCDKKADNTPTGPPPVCFSEGSAGGSCGTTNGDPHLTTFDQFRYDFQAVGEFVAVTSPSRDLVIQTRQAGLQDLRTVSVNTAVAIKVGADRLGFALSGSDIAVRVAGQATAMQRGERRLPGGGTLVRQVSSIPFGADAYVVRWPDGSAAQLDPIGAYGIRLYVDLVAGRKGKVSGLLGNFDGNPKNELSTRGGAVVPQPPAFDKLYRTFGESWRISQAESLFDYRPGQSTATFTDRSFPDRALTADQLPGAQRDGARAVCAAAGVTDPNVLQDCILDVAQTGLPAFAINSGNTQTTFLRGTGATLTIGTPGATARLLFSGSAGQRVFVDIDSSTLPDECNVVLLRGPTGSTVNFGCIISGRGLIDATTLTAAGQYAVVLDPAGAATGQARLRVITVTDQSGTIAPDGPEITASIADPGGIARFSFSAAAGQHVLLAVPSSTLPDLCGVLELKDPTGATLNAGCVINGRGLIDATGLTVAGTYVIVVDPGERATGDAQLRLITVTDQRGAIGVNGPEVTAKIEQPGAVARFTFAGTAGQKVTAVAAASTLPDQCGVLLLLDPGGSVVNSGCVIDGQGRIDATALPTTGQYTLEVNPAEVATGVTRLRLKS